MDHSEAYDYLPQWPPHCETCYLWFFILIHEDTLHKLPVEIYNQHIKLAHQ